MSGIQDYKLPAVVAGQCGRILGALSIQVNNNQLRAVSANINTVIFGMVQVNYKSYGIRACTIQRVADT
ncbi:hypothetical protein D3C75_1216510 [compost metagenome]